MKLGDTFLVSDPGETLDTHLWIVLSDPAKDPERVIIVNVTRWRDAQDQACVLEEDDHPWLTRRSCVNYRDAKVVSLQHLQSILSGDQIEQRDPLSEDLLRRVLNGVSDSRMILEHADMLEQQGLFDYE